MANKKNEIPVPMHPIGVEEKVLELLPGKSDRIKILDAAAGEGYISMKLNEKGFEVYPVDINPSNFKYKQLTCVKADLNEKIPFADGFFDLAISIETIEHLENPYQFFRELNRVLKPSGQLIITVPNVTNILSRLKYLINGRPVFFGKRAYKEWGHISPFTKWMLEGALKKTFFEIDTITTSSAFIPLINKYIDTQNPLFGHILILSARKIS